MIKFFLLGAFLAISTAASAQHAPEKIQPALEKPKAQDVSTSYCLYEDKKYSEGAVKAVDGHVLVCMVRDSISVSFDEGTQASRELVWELGSSLRGKSSTKMPTNVSK